MATILYCFYKFYNSIQIIEKFSNHGILPNWKCYSIQLLFLESIYLIDQISLWQFGNSIIQSALAIFKYLLSINWIAKLQSINQIAKLHSIIWIDCKSNTENILYFKVL